MKKAIFPKKNNAAGENPFEQTTTSHDSLVFGVVYVNELAKAEFEKISPQFPAGSIIVREKHSSAASETPDTVIAMVKRENSFSKETDDWEFFTFNGKDLTLQKRETKGDCAKCHIQAINVGWVFRDYLK